MKEKPKSMSHYVQPRNISCPLWLGLMEGKLAEYCQPSSLQPLYKVKASSLPVGEALPISFIQGQLQHVFWHLEHHPQSLLNSLKGWRECSFHIILKSDQGVKWNKTNIYQVNYRHLTGKKKVSISVYVAFNLFHLITGESGALVTSNTTTSQKVVLGTLNH